MNRHYRVLYMQTYSAYLSKRVRDQLHLRSTLHSTRYEYLDGKVITMTVSRDMFNRSAEHVAVISAIHHYDRTLRYTKILYHEHVCAVCGDFTLCEFNRSLCAQCARYIEACANDVRDHTIVCRHHNYRPFVVISGTPYTVVTFREECATWWCDVARQGDDVHARRYQQALIRHTWWYSQATSPLVCNIRYAVINLALRDNDLGVDQTTPTQ